LIPFKFNWQWTAKADFITTAQEDNIKQEPLFLSLTYGENALHLLEQRNKDLLIVLSVGHSVDQADWVLFSIPILNTKRGLWFDYLRGDPTASQPQQAS
jgi:hypothetical protein